MRKNLLFGLFTTFLAFNASAQNQKISFESSEGFILGNLNTQNNWFNWGYVSDENSKIIETTLATDGANATQIIDNEAEEGNWGGIAYPIEQYSKYTISADVYLDENNLSDYEMLALYNEHNEYYLVSSIFFNFDGKITFEDTETSVDLGEWTPKKWYNVKAEVDLPAKKVVYYLDNKKVHEIALTSESDQITEVDFSFDNYGSSFYVDNVQITDHTDLSITENSEKKLSIYPNPVQDILTINSAQKVEQIQLYNLVGQLVFESNHAESINLNQLNAGTYIIKIKTENEIISKKIIKK